MELSIKGSKFQCFLTLEGLPVVRRFKVGQYQYLRSSEGHRSVGKRP
jgi:hypothetical protein